jgi:hypothetical protein
MLFEQWTAFYMCMQTVRDTWMVQIDACCCLFCARKPTASHVMRILMYTHKDVHVYDKKTYLTHAHA